MNLDAELRTFRESLQEYREFLRQAVYWDVSGTISGVRDPDRPQEEQLREDLHEKWGRLRPTVTQQLPEVGWQVSRSGQVFSVVEEALSAEIQVRKMEFLDFAIDAVSRAIGAAARREAPSTALATTPTIVPRKIFIGHGRSTTWKVLQEFLADRLKLDVEEFNSESTAGIPTAERLLHMLENCCFAFLVMTAEDEHSDGTKHARENVVHEIGLFQGRYGFERAIVVFEAGCTKFSNISGIGQIRFPKGDIMARSEEIRRVLEREGIASAPEQPTST